MTSIEVVWRNHIPESLGHSFLKALIDFIIHATVIKIAAINKDKLGAREAAIHIGVNLPILLKQMCIYLEQQLESHYSITVGFLLEEASIPPTLW